MSVSRLTATGVQVLDAGGTPAARLTGIGAQVLDAGGTPAARLTGIGAQVLVLDPDYQPIPGKVVLTWEEDNTSDTAHNVYHDTTTLDPEALPAALASLDPSLKKYEHVGTFSPVETQYYRVGVTNGSIEVISAETSVGAVGHVNAQLDVVLVVNDDTHDATTNTRQALIDGGFDADRITVAEDSGTIPAGDVIVVCRALDTQADTDKVLAHWANGIPVVWGSINGVLPGTGLSGASTFADLTGTFEVVSNSPGIDGIDVTDATHYITSPFGLGQTVMFAGADYGYALDTGASFVGTKLADADPDHADVAGQASLIAVEAGTNDLLGNPTPARSVVWGDIYAGQSAYSADGVTLLSRIVQWCLGYDEFLN